MAAAKKVLRYVKGTVDLGILLPNRMNSDAEMYGYIDSDWNGDIVDRKSTSGYLFMLGNAPISWCSKKQNVVALSSCEAEYIAAAQGAGQAQWIEKLLTEMNLKGDYVMKLRDDNKSAIDLAKHHVSHGRSKHIETKFHFLRDQVNREILELVYCKSSEQLADLLTKPLAAKRFAELRDLIGMKKLGDLN